MTTLGERLLAYGAALVILAFLELRNALDWLDRRTRAK